MTRKLMLGLMMTMMLVVGYSPRLCAAAQGPSVASAVDPEVTGALGRMGAFLRGMKAFQVKAEVTTEDVLVDGQKIQHSTAGDMIVRRPNQVRVIVTGDHPDRVFLYDGKNFTIWAPRANYYASLSAPATIGELIEHLNNKYGIEFPLIDLFRWSDAGADFAGINSAIDVGPSRVGDTVCEQYALRQRGVDWQIWIQNGDYPLPRKVVATILSDAARPEYTVRYTWNLAPAFNDAMFVFLPPQGARKIDMAQLKAVADSVQNQAN